MNDHNERKTIASGSGGAHARWLMFGARGPLLAPEGDPSGGGATGAGSGAGNGGTTGGTPTPGENALPKTFSQEEVNRIAAAAREDGRKSATKAQQQQAAPQPAPNAGSEDERLSLRLLKAELDETKMRGAFDKRASKLGIDDDAAETLFALYKAQNPTDPGEWFERTSKLFGLGSKTTPPPQPPTGSPTEGAKPPLGAPRPPERVDPHTSGGLLDIWNLPLDQVTKMGPAGLRAEFEKHLAIAAQSSGAPPLPKVGPRK